MECIILLKYGTLHIEAHDSAPQLCSTSTCLNTSFPQLSNGSKEYKTASSALDNMTCQQCRQMHNNVVVLSIHLLSNKNNEQGT